MCSWFKFFSILISSSDFSVWFWMQREWMMYAFKSYVFHTYSDFFDGNNRMSGMERLARWAVHFVYSPKGSGTQLFVNLISVKSELSSHFDLFVVWGKFSKWWNSCALFHTVSQSSAQKKCTAAGSKELLLMISGITHFRSIDSNFTSSITRITSQHQWFIY